MGPGLGASLGRRFAAGLHSPHTDRLREIAVPTLILWGGRDRLIPPAYATRFRQDIAGSRLVVFPELGHVPHEEDPGATVAAVVDFLSDGLVEPAGDGPVATQPAT